MASSSNGRFAEGATAIDGRMLSRTEAVGKNLFAFFAATKYGKGRKVGCSVEEEEEEGGEDIVVHVHLGMSGAWVMSIYARTVEGLAPWLTTRPKTAVTRIETATARIGREHWRLQ